MPQKFFTAPNQHRLYSDLQEEPGNTAPPPFPGALPHIHSKTACRGFKSFCPCQKSQVSLLRCLTFSLVCGRIWQRGTAAPCAVRVVGACSPVGCVQAPVSAPASVGAGRSPLGSSTRGGSRDKSVPRFPPSFPVFSIRSHLFPTVPIPSSTQNAPGFAFFGPIRVRFPCFFPFLTCKIFRILFVHSADLVHRLKSLVIPLSRDVSFFT